jgi:acyl dehydratase
VPINRDYMGRTFAPTEPYEVSRTKIAEFATAIGEPSPLCHDPAAARQAGYPDVIAPPTFAIVITTTSNVQVIHDSGLGVNYSMVVHGEQAFEHARPLHAGDWVVATSTIEDIREVGRHMMMTTRTDITTVDGEHVCTARGMLVERGA